MAEVASAFVSLLPSAKGFGSKLEGQVGGEVKSSGSRLGGQLSGALKAGALAGIAGAGLLIGKAVTDGLNFEAGTSKLTAQLGLTSKESARVGKVSGTLFGQGFGTGMDQVQEAIGSVIQNIDGMRGASDATLSRISGKVTNTANIFDQDLGGVTRSVSQLMRTGLAKNADQALDIITKGFQSGANKSDDFLDTLNEYGTQFRKVGIDGKTATGLISQGLRAGARDGDLVADSIKEFSLRAIDGSKTTAAGFSAIGLNAGKMAAQIAKGGPAAQKGLDTVLDRLRGMKDPVKQSQAAVALFGSQAEDMGKALFALDPSKAVAGLGKVKGAADAAGNAFNDNAKARITTFFRGIQQGATNAVGGVILPALAKLGPVLTSVGAVMQRAFQAALPTLLRIGSAIATTFLPVLRTAATTFTTDVLPAVLRVAGYLQANLVPIFQKVGSIIATQVVPIIASLARFFYGTLYPAVVRIVSAIAVQLKPVFDQLFRTIQTSVLPTVQNLLAKFRQALPTIQRVISVVVRITGKVLVFAAAVLGKVLPPLIRFAAFLLKNAVGAVIAVIGVLAKIVGVFIRVGGAVANGIKAFARFSDAVDNHVRAALRFVGSIPGKIKGFFSSAGTLLSNIGSQIVQGLINGIKGSADRVLDAARSLVDKIPKTVRKLMGIASPSKVMKKIGGHIGDGLLVGLKKSLTKVKSRLDSDISSMVERVQGLQTSAADLAAGIADKFRGDLFTGGLTEFNAQLRLDTQNANAFSAALAAAAGKGLSGGLYQAVATSGNVQVAQELANLTRAHIATEETLFNVRENAAQAAGQTPADRIYGETIQAQLRELQGLRADFKQVSDRLTRVQTQITVNDKSGSPKKTAKEVSRQMAHKGGG